MNGYSKDLRIKVLDAVERETPRREAARLLGISLSTTKRYIERRREGGDLSPRLSPGRTPRILATAEEKRAFLWAQLEANDDVVTLERHCELWEEERGVRVSVTTMSRAIREKLGWTFKKVVGGLRAKRASAKCLARAPERGGSEAAGVRGRIFHQHRPHHEVRQSTEGREGLRQGAEELGQENVTLISSISLEEGNGPSLSIEGSSDGESFSLYLRELLCG